MFTLNSLAGLMPTFVTFVTLSVYTVWYLLMENLSDNDCLCLNVSIIRGDSFNGNKLTPSIAFAVSALLSYSANKFINLSYALQYLASNSLFLSLISSPAPSFSFPDIRAALVKLERFFALPEHEDQRRKTDSLPVGTIKVLHPSLQC